MPFVTLARSPLAPGGGPVELYYRDAGGGDGLPIVVLHGGWGYGFYPFDAQIAALGDHHRFVIPDRSGHGRSTPTAGLPPRFHAAAADETLAVLDALGVARCAVWGHSDGAVIATRLALAAPARVAALIVEALHVDRAKPRSRAFFTRMAEDPDGFGPKVAARLAADHGDRWRDVLRADGRAWLDFAATPDADFYDHRLGELAMPVLVISGRDDPRAEPGELDRVRRDVPHAEVHELAGGRHSPHSEPATAAEVTRIADAFVARYGRAWPSSR